MATFVALDPASGAPLHRQLFTGLRRAIVEGRLAAGTRLPSTRTMAEQLDLSRNTVMGAFEQLLAEGYVVGRVGSGTYVADELPERAVTASRRAGGQRNATDTTAVAGTTVTPSARSRALLAAPCPFFRPPPPPGGGLLAFRVGAPDREHFPAEAWGRLMTRRWNRSRDDLLAHSDPRGYAPLREAVCDYVTTARGVRCTPEQVLIVAGTQQAVALTAQVVLDPDDAAWVEDPGYPGSRGALVAAGARIVPVPVDADGIDVAAGVRAAPGAKLAVVSPAHELPLGVTLSAARRRALLDWAREAKAWIFEDDYDSEYRYAGRPLPALQGETADAPHRVIYCGTFSKVLSPAMRLAYLVVPPALVRSFVTAKAFADVQCPPLEQAVLTDFVAQGHFARHVRRTRVLYAKRQALLIRHARRELAGLLDVRPLPAGMHLVGGLPPGTDDLAVSRRAAQAGVEALPLSGFAIAARTPPALVLGYAVVPDAQIAEGVRRLRDVLRGR
jgi:GntR family transcriptional regulator/MocR family aminotransferase